MCAYAHMRTRWLEFDFLCTYVSFWLCLIHCSVSEDSLPKKTRLSSFAPSPLAGGNSTKNPSPLPDYTHASYPFGISSVRLALSLQPRKNQESRRPLPILTDSQPAVLFARSRISSVSLRRNAPLALPPPTQNKITTQNKNSNSKTK